MRGRKVVVVQHLFIATHSSETPVHQFLEIFPFLKTRQMNCCGVCVTRDVRLHLYKMHCPVCCYIKHNQVVL